MTPVPPVTRVCSGSRLISLQGQAVWGLTSRWLQANVWTEYIGNEPTVEYMLLPRLCAMAEVLWSPAAAKDWDSFLQRLPVLFAHFDATGLRYRPLG